MGSKGVRRAAAGFVLLVAFLHVYFLVLEMFLWQTPFGMKTFGTTPEVAASSAVLAANQGLYNGFLAAGLLWALFSYGVVGGRAALTFFLACVLVAGVYGGATANVRILFVQGVPALIALALVWASRGSSTTPQAGARSA
jgi:putative membrane protein